MKRKSDRNLAVIQNFILHLTHSGEHGMDALYKEEQTYTPEIMYRVAKEYIQEDHSDGVDGDEEYDNTITKCDLCHKEFEKDELKRWKLDSSYLACDDCNDETQNP